MGRYELTFTREEIDASLTVKYVRLIASIIEAATLLERISSFEAFDCDYEFVAIAIRHGFVWN